MGARATSSAEASTPASDFSRPIENPSPVHSPICIITLDGEPSLSALRNAATILEMAALTFDTTALSGPMRALANDVAALAPMERSWPGRPEMALMMAVETARHAADARVRMADHAFEMSVPRAAEDR